MQLYNGRDVDISDLSHLESILGAVHVTFEPGNDIMQLTDLADSTARYFGRVYGSGNYLGVHVHPVRSLGQHAIARMHVLISDEPTLLATQRYFHDAFVVQQALRSDASLQEAFTTIATEYDDHLAILKHACEQLANRLQSNDTMQ